MRIIYQVYNDCTKISGCESGYIGDSCQTPRRADSYTHDEILQMVNNILAPDNLSNVFDEIADQIGSDAGAYVIVLKTNWMDSPYYNFISNGAKNYYDRGSVVYNFQNTIFNLRSSGDLIDVTDGGFWWNCVNNDKNYSPGYIAVSNYGWGTLDSASWIKNDGGVNQYYHTIWTDTNRNVSFSVLLIGVPN